MFLLVLVSIAWSGTQGAPVSSRQEKRDLNIADFMFSGFSRTREVPSEDSPPLSCQVSQTRGLAPGRILIGTTVMPEHRYNGALQITQFRSFG